MNTGIHTGNVPTPEDPSSRRRFVPMQVGNATIFIEKQPESVLIEDDGSIHGVSFNAREAFSQASEFLSTCADSIGRRLEALAEQVKPQEVTVEFDINFEVEGQASLIPVLLTGKTSSKAGLKVKVVWKRPSNDSGGESE